MERVDVLPLTPEEKLKLVEERRRAAEGALWQLPGLSLTAQAFLLAAGLAHDTPGWARGIAGGLGIAVVAVTLGVLAFQGVRMTIFGYWVDYQVQAITENNLVAELEGTRFALKPHQEKLRKRNVDPFVLWGVTLGLFFLADVAVLVKSI
jgi:hypothetical protein